jgi:hypothetical protein
MEAGSHRVKGTLLAKGMPFRLMKSTSLVPQAVVALAPPPVQLDAMQSPILRLVTSDGELQKPPKTSTCVALLTKKLPSPSLS